MNGEEKEQEEEGGLISEKDKTCLVLGRKRLNVVV